MLFSHSKDQKQLDSDKAWHVGCIDIDGYALSLDFNLGTGPYGHKNVYAYSLTGCAEDSKLGFIPGIDTDNDAYRDKCIPADDFMISEPNHYGHRINSIRFGNNDYDIPT